MMRELLARLLGAGADGPLVAGAGTIREALALAAVLPPDVAVVDWRLPDGHGPELVRALRRIHPAIRVLVVSSNEQAHLVRASIRAGAAGVVMKRSSTETLRAAVAAVHAGGHYFCPLSLRLLVEAMRAEAAVPLTASEHVVLRAVAGGENLKSIAARRRLRPKTVHNHLSNL